MPLLSRPNVSELLEKAKTIKLLALDVDGVMTHGEIIYTDDGREMKVFDAKDGHGLAMLTHSGMSVAIITGRTSAINIRRAEELGIPHLYQGVKNKLVVLNELLVQLKLSLAEVLYMGDDTPDIPVLERVGLAICPADAVEEVQRICHDATDAPGGRGAIREVADLLLLAHCGE